MVTIDYHQQQIIGLFMNCRKTMFWRFGIAGTALLAAVLVYCLARIYPPELLTPFQTTVPLLAKQAAVFGNAPSFFYTFAVGLFIGAFAPSSTAARWHCLNWLGLALLLEISQHPFIAIPMTSWLADTLFTSTWEIIGPYWKRGVFDPQDIIATVAGGLAALAILSYFSTGHVDEHL